LIDDEPRATQVYPVTLLHTNDFHGNLETDHKGRGGSAYMAGVIEDVGAAEGEGRIVYVP
jgi:2',3'-cyclic-nucleotide 2'-phosphodiesterase (5'-nucleotidase family)